MANATLVGYGANKMNLIYCVNCRSLKAIPHSMVDFIIIKGKPITINWPCQCVPFKCVHFACSIRPDGEIIIKQCV